MSPSRKNEDPYGQEEMCRMCECAIIVIVNSIINVTVAVRSKKIGCS